METRAALFAFAGKAFLDPQPEALRPAAEDLGLEDFEHALEGDAADLEREYVRLFLNPAGAPCPPWQSAQGAEGQLFGDAHHAALAWYRSGGVEANLDGQPADHIGLLLTYYAHLLESGAEPEQLERFRAGHLEWMAAYLDGVAAQARHPFFTLLAAFTRQLLAAE